jgi:hypothetical protein
MTFAKNMGTADRAIRSLAAIAIAALYFTGVISGPLAVILGVIAIAFLVTSFIGSCPGYLPLGLSTRKRPPAGV